MNDREGKEKGGAAPEATHRKKNRRAEGPAAQALLDLCSLLIVFANDLKDPEVSVEEAAKFFDENLSKFYSNHAPRR